MRRYEAINTHTDWKIRLRWAISERSAVDIDAISNPEKCELGMWLGRERAARYHSPLYAKCLEAHARFHEEAAKVATLVNAKQYAEATQRLGRGTPYSLASVELVHAIEDLRLDGSNPVQPKDVD